MNERHNNRQIADTYEEFAVGEKTVAMIADPRNECAWIQSDVTRPIEP